MKARNDCEIACDCVKRANVVLHVRLCKEIFARKHTATHKSTSAQPLSAPHSDQRDTHTYIHTRINRLWSPLAYGLGGNNRLWSPLAYGLGGNKLFFFFHVLLLPCRNQKKIWPRIKKKSKTSQCTETCIGPTVGTVGPIVGAGLLHRSFSLPNFANI